MAEVKERTFSKDEAYQLAEKMAAHGTANYLIREALIDKGFSAYESNELINRMRRAHIDDPIHEPLDMVQIGLTIVLLAVVLIMVIVLLGNPT